MKKPTLSIITICYNIKDEIERTCKSIVNQTWQDFEWIVVDGGSTDGTVEVLKKYQDRMTVFISEPDKGVYNAMNKGIKRAHGEWLNFMNGGDCFADKNVLEKVFKNKTYDADVLYGDVIIVNMNGEEKIRTYFDKLSEDFWRKSTVCHQSAFLKRKLFREFKPYNEKYKIASDWEKFTVAFLCHKKFTHIKFCVARFFLGGISYRSSLIKQEKELFYKTFRQIKVIRYFLFGFIPLLSIEEK